MDYQKKYLEYKVKYHLLKKQIGGMDKLFNFEAPILLKRETPEERAIRRQNDEKRLADERKLADERERQRLADEKKRADEIKAMADVSLPPELVLKTMDIGNINYEDLISQRRPELKNVIDTFILDTLTENTLPMDKALFAYNLRLDIRDKIKQILLANITNERMTIEQLYFIFKNFSVPELRRAVNEVANKIDILSLSISDLANLYKITNKQSIFDLISIKIASNKLSLSEIVILNSINDFQPLLEEIINTAYDIKFSANTRLYDNTMYQNIKLMHIVIHFVCNRLISLNESDNYAIEIEFSGSSRIVSTPSKFTYSYSKIGNSIIETRLGLRGRDIGEFNFDNLLFLIINEVDTKLQYNNKIISINLVKIIYNSKKYMLKYKLTEN